MSRIIENPRNLILNEAKKILYNEGYSKISIRRVAKECNISIGTIYNYFPTKKDLIVEMMSNFWDDYFHNIENISKSNETFYVKLKNIYDDLAKFINKFREIWLKSDIYSTPDYIESGLKRENVYINKLIFIIENLLIKDIYNKDSGNSRKFSTYDMASFIITNFISLVQLPYCDYKLFENILKELI